MRKKSQDELGTLVTREMKVMLQDEELTKEQRFDVLAAVMFDTPIKNSLLASFAKSLKAGFEQVNSSRYRAIEREREWRKNHERRRRNAGYIDDNGTPCNSMSLHEHPCNSMSLHEHPCNSMSLHDGLKQNKTKQGISPYKPPKGGGRKVPKADEPEDLVRRQQSDDSKGDGVRTATLAELADILAKDLEGTEAFAHMRVNRRNLMRHLLPIVKKNCAAEEGEDGGTSEKQRKAFGKLQQLVLAGLAAWTEKWAADGWQYAPGKITKWLADEKWLEKPRKKTAPAEGSGCGDCGAEIA